MARVYDEVLQRGTVANTTQSNQRRSIHVAACHEALPRVRATDAARCNVARRSVARRNVARRNVAACRDSAHCAALAVPARWGRGFTSSPHSIKSARHPQLVSLSSRSNRPPRSRAAWRAFGCADQRHSVATWQPFVQTPTSQCDSMGVVACVCSPGMFSWQQMWNGQHSPDDKNGNVFGCAPARPVCWQCRGIPLATLNGPVARILVPSLDSPVVEWPRLARDRTREYAWGPACACAARAYRDECSQRVLVGH
jgi:hypothetical protein